MDGTKHPLTDIEQRLVDAAVGHGFHLTHQVKYYCELEHAESRITIYLDRKRTPGNVIVVMVHPEMDMTLLHTGRGLAISSELRHGSNMRRFPKRLHTGSAPIPYARSVECADITAFGRLLHALAVSSDTPGGVALLEPGGQPDGVDRLLGDQGHLGARDSGSAQR